MIITNQQELKTFIQSTNDVKAIKEVFEECLNSKVLFIWSDNTGMLVDEWKEKLISFIDEYGFKPIEMRPIIVDLY